jgi:hypothetical protein
MTMAHTVGTRAQWLTARRELLVAEKELTRRCDELARQRQALPWVRLDQPYRLDTDAGEASLADLFQRGLWARRRRHLGHVSMARSCPARPQRDGPLVAPSRQVRRAVSHDDEA